MADGDSYDRLFIVLKKAFHKLAVKHAYTQSDTYFDDKHLFVL